jgi:hypothetical protein
VSVPTQKAPQIIVGDANLTAEPVCMQFTAEDPTPYGFCANPTFLGDIFDGQHPLPPRGVRTHDFCLR